MSDQKTSDMQDLLVSSQILKNLAESLGQAVNHSFMSREHGASVWKQVLRVSGFDVTRKSLFEQK